MCLLRSKDNRFDLFFYFRIRTTNILLPPKKEIMQQITGTAEHKYNHLVRYSFSIREQL